MVYARNAKGYSSASSATLIIAANVPPMMYVLTVGTITPNGLALPLAILGYSFLNWRSTITGYYI